MPVIEDYLHIAGLSLGPADGPFVCFRPGAYLPLDFWIAFPPLSMSLPTPLIVLHPVRIVIDKLADSIASANFFFIVILLSNNYKL